MLLDAKASVNAVTMKCKEAPLHKATNPEVIKMLVAAKADLEALSGQNQVTNMQLS